MYFQSYDYYCVFVTVDPSGIMGGMVIQYGFMSKQAILVLVFSMGSGQTQYKCHKQERK